MPALLQVIQYGELRGAEVFALDLSAALAREGRWSVSLLSLFGAEAAYRTASERAGVRPIEAAPGGRAGGLDLRLVWRLRSLIDDGGYQVVQANGAATLKYLASVRRLGSSRWALVYRAIGMGAYWRRGLSTRVVYRWLLSQPDRIVAVSRAVADDLLAGGVDPRRVVVVPNGVEPARIGAEAGDRERTRRELGMAEGEALLVYAGSLAPEKNLSAIVSTVARGREAGVAVHAALVGDGPCRAALAEEARRRGVGTAVHIVPGQPRIGRYLAAADLCVLPSRSEGMPALLIEAGLAGVPSVAYAVGGIPEVVEHGVTGCLVEAHDQAALERAVLALLRDDPRRAAMGAAARERCRRYEIAAIVPAYTHTYAGLLNGQGHA